MQVSTKTRKFSCLTFVLCKMWFLARSRGFLAYILVSDYLLRRKLNDPDAELVSSSSASTYVVEKCLFKFPNIYLAVGSRVKDCYFFGLIVSLIADVAINSVHTAKRLWMCATGGCKPVNFRVQYILGFFPSLRSILKAKTIEKRKQWQ